MLTENIVWLLLDTIRVIDVERCLLGLNRVLLMKKSWLLSKLIKPSLLRDEAIRISILEAGLLWLSILVVQKSRTLRLLLKRISEPIYCRLLLVTLIETGWLRLSWHRSIIEQRCRVLVFQFPSSKFFFLFAQLDGFLQIRIIICTPSFFGSAFRILLRFMFARFDG